MLPLVGVKTRRIRLVKMNSAPALPLGFTYLDTIVTRDVRVLDIVNNEGDLSALRGSGITKVNRVPGLTGEPAPCLPIVRQTAQENNRD